ncbi:MAG: right-handed parallel beta-helix repeat-containing protein [Tepidisphaeraceae bacterium]|jgi:parallel beta-helix repeat protein
MTSRPLLEPLEKRLLIANYVVSPTGSDAASGSASMPWQTLQHAADSVQPGDTVSVLPGQYTGFDLTTSGTPNAPISFAASSGTVIDTRNSHTPDGINLEGASYVLIEGFTVQGLPRCGIRAVQDQGVRIFDNHIDASGIWGILTGFSTDVDIESNTVTGSVQQHGIYVGNSAPNPIIKNNVVAGNSVCGIQINSDATQGGTGIITGALIDGNIIFNNGASGGAAINLDGVQQSTIENNLIYDNHSAGIAIYRHDGAASPKDDIVVNNTILMASDARWAVAVLDSATGIFLGNNIILTNSQRRGAISVADDSKAGLTSDFNAVADRFSADGGDSILSLQDWQQATGQDTHSMLATPDGMFADLEKGDFHLAQDSPAQNAGSLLHAPTKDIEGKLPIDPKHPAIGAYQRTKDSPAGMIQSTFSEPAAQAYFGWRIWATALAAFVGVVALCTAWAAHRRNVHRWLGPYLFQSLRPRLRRSKEKHVLICIADHYEPQVGNVRTDRALERTRRWAEDYPLLLSKYRDSDGKPPRHTFFYPLEQYAAPEMEMLAELCRAGYGEVEIHLHHDRDTSENLRRQLLRHVRLLSNQYGMLATHKKDGRIMYGFVHGNWALDNSRPDGRWCGVDDELEILRQTGCYADFTLPSAPNSTQVGKINSIYYAVEDGLPRSHEVGVNVGRGPRPADSLMLIQGPLTLNWRDLKWGLLPRVENGCIQANQAPSMHRLKLWLKANVQIPSRPDWYFVKLHTHGAPEDNRQVLLGPAMFSFHTALAKRSMFDHNFYYHYVTAREMYNLARAAEDGYKGPVDAARDYELIFNAVATRSLALPPTRGTCPA